MSLKIKKNKETTCKLKISMSRTFFIEKKAFGRKFSHSAGKLMKRLLVTTCTALERINQFEHFLVNDCRKILLAVNARLRVSFVYINVLLPSQTCMKILHVALMNAGIF